MQSDTNIQANRGEEARRQQNTTGYSLLPAVDVVEDQGGITLMRTFPVSPRTTLMSGLRAVIC
jgi:hypothetical protein